MDYTCLTKIENNLLTGKYIINGKDFKVGNIFDINVEQGNQVSIVFLNIDEEATINFNAKKNSLLKMSFLQEKPCKILINGEILERSNVACYYADFASGNVTLKTNIKLMEVNSECIWNLSSLTKDKDNKEFDVSIYHKSKKTKCEINNYGVSRDESRLLFSGICKIENGSHESVAHQNSKIMVFDEASDAIAKPILKIDDNDIEASHAAVVGKISDDHLFYLTSRGLSIQKARELITYGYLKPILNGFDDEELQRQINTLIERGL